MKAFILSCCLILFNGVWIYGSENLDSVLTELKKEVQTRGERDRKKEYRISVLKDVLREDASPEIRFEQLSDIYDEYKVYQYDSAQVYAMQMLQLSQQLNSKEASARAATNLTHAYLSVGFYKEAYEIASAVDTTGLSPEITVNYLVTIRHLYQNLAQYANSSHSMSSYYWDKFSEINNLIPTYASRMSDKDGTAATASEDERDHTGHSESNDNECAIQYYIKGEKSQADGDLRQAAYYLAKSAIYDIRGNVKENRATTTLAKILLEMGEIKDAAFFIALAREDAEYSNSPIRKMGINGISTRIDNELLLQSEKKRHAVISITICIIVALMLFIALLSILHHRNGILRKMHFEAEEKGRLLDKANAKLSELNNALLKVNEIKRRYIVRSICTDHTFVNEVEEKTRTIERKIVARQYDDARDMLKSLNIKKEHRRIANEFDSGFLSLFPNFLDEFNRLFPQDAPYTLTEDGFLPNEVRIYALLRLGVEDTSLVSKYLNITPNTIYVYKTRVKARTIVAKDEFEQRVMQIPQP